MEKKYTHYTRNKTRNHVNHIREHQSQLWKDFLSLRNIAKVPNSDSHIVQTPSIHHAYAIYLQLNKERSEKKSEDSMVSRIIKLDSSEPVKWPLFPHRFRSRIFGFGRNVD